MVATVSTVAYLGLEARAVEVQVQPSTGLPAFVIVGLPDKAVAESRERVRAALSAIGLALPPKRITMVVLGSMLQLAAIAGAIMWTIYLGRIAKEMKAIRSAITSAWAAPDHRRG
jgi:predicted ATPase with chaperone activity